MITGLEKAAAAIQAAELNHEIIAQNLAYLDTPGYRRAVVSFENVMAFEDADAASLDDLTTGPIEGGVGGNERLLVASVSRDHSAGVLEITDRSLDVAIEGDGFFVLDGPNGPLFTRAGVFFVSQENELVTAAGYPIQGTRGPLVIPSEVSPNELEIGRDGAVFARGSQLGQIQVVRFEDNSQLLPAGIALFSGEGLDRVTADVSVRQGARERSNVSATSELTRMIIGMRHHEAAQRALRSISDALQQHTKAEGA